MVTKVKESQELEIPIVVGELGEICAIRATNRQVLIDFINAHVDSDFSKRHDGASYLSVALSGEKLGCEGCFADYKAEADIPESSVPCSCGNPKHWLIKYDEEGEK